MGKMRYFAKIIDGVAYCVIRTDKDSVYERFDWLTKDWVFDRESFRSMSGIGGDGFDWYEISRAEAEAFIKARLESFRNE